VHQPAEPQGARRLRWLFRISLACFLGVLAQLVNLQVYRHRDLERQAIQQQELDLEVQPPRGSVLDRSGQPLAMSVAVDSVSMDPSRLEDPQVAVEIASEVLGLDAEELWSRIQWAEAHQRRFLWIKRRITPAESERLRSYRLEGIEFNAESSRVYPKGRLAAHVIGDVDFQEKGNYGIEQQLNQELSGTPGSVHRLLDVKRRGIDSQVSVPTEPGSNVLLTIDERIQYAAEQSLEAAARVHGCRTGSVVVLKPDTGEVLALANYPTFDPNEAAERITARDNLAVSVPYEPGSVMKVITIAAALETTALRPESVIACGNGQLHFAGRVIHDTAAYGSLSMADVLAKSSNLGAIQIGMRVGERRLHEYLRRFGFGRPTGVMLPAESPGLLRELSAWSRGSIASLAMGHEMSATTTQLAQACAAIANGGLLMTPRLVAWKQKPGEERELIPAAGPRRILRPETAILLRQMMERVVLHGTGRQARLEGYTAGGKTGTAQIFDLDAGRYTHLYNASFIGFAPVNQPRVAVAVTLNGASEYGAAVAAPVFREVVTQALRALRVPKDVPEPAPAPTGAATASRRSGARQCMGPNGHAVCIEVPARETLVAGVRAEPGLPSAPPPVAAPAMTPAVPGQLLLGPRVPDFSGQSVRSVVGQAVALGLVVEPIGSGLARSQNPPPGSVVARGERIRVEFAR